MKGKMKLLVLLGFVSLAGCATLPPGSGQLRADGVECVTSRFVIETPLRPGQEPGLQVPHGRVVSRGCAPDFQVIGADRKKVLIVFEEGDPQRNPDQTTPFEDMGGNRVYVFRAIDAHRIRARSGGVCSAAPGCKYSIVFTGRDGAHPPKDPYIIVNQQ